MREKEGFRDLVEDILAYTNGRHLLTIADCAGYLGIDRDTVTRRFGVTKKGIAAVMLARQLVSLAEPKKR